MLRSFVFVLACLPVAAFAVGSDTSAEETTPPKPTETTLDCVDGQVWDAETAACVEVESQLLDDDTLYGAAREFAYAGQYDAARTAVLAMAVQDDGRAETYLGFTARKMGDWDAAKAHYDRAIAQNPDNILARSYMAQGLVERGDKAGAELQLTEIRARGGQGSWAEAALEEAIATGVTSRY
ncbi:MULTISPECIES: tetratricopeptide repeat protein [unclassified Marinovum]